MFEFNELVEKYLMLAAKAYIKVALTFGFVVGKLMVGQAKPSLLEILHSKAVSALCSLYHKPEKKYI